MPASNTSPVPPHDATHGTVEMPRPTAWPIVLALGVTLMALGAATSLAFSAVGGVLFVIGLLGWISQLLGGRGHEHESLAAPADRPRQSVSHAGAVEQLKLGVVGYRFQLPEKVHPVSAGIKGGIVGGLLMPIPALAWGISSGHGIWFPVNLLSGMVVPGLNELSVQQLEAFHPWMFLGAVVMHVLMSLGFGLVGGVLLPTLPPVPGGPLLFGGLILPLLWTAANHTLLEIVNPVLNRYIDWRWYVASQLVYGIATSIVILRSEKIQIAPRGPGGDSGGPSIPPGWLGCLLIVCIFAGGCSDDFPGKPKVQDKFVMPQKITDFATLYSTRCAGCHGADGTLGAGPPLADPMFLALVSDDELHRVIANGRHGTLMPAWLDRAGGPLTEQQVSVLVAGIKQREWKNVDNASASADQNVFPSAPPLVAQDSASGNPQAGKEAFAQACANCHGEDGRNGEFGDLNDPAFLALVSDQILRRYIITGRHDLGMPDFADPKGRDKTTFKPLSSQQVSDIVALLGQLAHGHGVGKLAPRIIMAKSKPKQDHASPAPRRTFLALLTLLGGALATAVVAIPGVEYLAAAIRRQKPTDKNWVSLGAVSDFPVRETRLKTFDNPLAQAWDGICAQTGVWVRNLGRDEKFQDQFNVFAINCTHLGCPVEWFPQSGLFMCPCHGGVYYEDGERASGPPPRGLYHCDWRVTDGKLEIQAPFLPTLQHTLIRHDSV